MTSHEDFEIKFKIDSSSKKSLKGIKENPEEVVKGERKEQTLYTLFLSEFDKFSKIYQLTQQIKRDFWFRPGGSPVGEFIVPYANINQGIPPVSFIHSKFESWELLSFALNPYIIRVISDEKLDEISLQDEYKDILRRLCFVFQYVDWNPLLWVRDLIKFEYTKEKERLKKLKDEENQRIMYNYQKNTNKNNFYNRQDYFYAKQREMFLKRQSKQNLSLNYSTAKQDLMGVKKDYSEKYKDLAPKLHYYAWKQIKPLRGSFKGYLGGLMLIDNGGKPPKNWTFLNWNFFMGDLWTNRVFSPLTGKLETGAGVIPIFIRSSRKSEFVEKIWKRIKKLLDKVQKMLFDNPMIFFEESKDERKLIMAEINEEVDRVVSPWFWDDIEAKDEEQTEEDIYNFLTEDISIDFSQEENNNKENFNSKKSNLIDSWQNSNKGFLDWFNKI